MVEKSSCGWRLQLARRAFARQERGTCVAGRQAPRVGASTNLRMEADVLMFAYASASKLNASDAPCRPKSIVTTRETMMMREQSHIEASLHSQKTRHM
jgi:hypothetical protein